MLVARALKNSQLTCGHMPATYETMHYSQVPASICSRVGLIECLPLLRMRGRRTRRNFRSSRCPARLCSSDWAINSFNRIPRRAASAFTRLKRASGRSTVVRIKAYSHNCRGWQSIRLQRLEGDSRNKPMSLEALPLIRGSPTGLTPPAFKQCSIARASAWVADRLPSETPIKREKRDRSNIVDRDPKRPGALG